MCFERSIIDILLVYEKTSGIVAVPVHDVHQAAWLFARFSSQDPKDFCSFVSTAWFCHPNNSKNGHV